LTSPGDDMNQIVHIESGGGCRRELDQEEPMNVSLEVQGGEGKGQEQMPLYSSADGENCKLRWRKKAVRVLKAKTARSILKRNRRRAENSLERNFKKGKREKKN